MDPILEMLFKNKSPEEITNMLVNFNKINLNRKTHIKKYNKLRKLHSEILDSMQAYIESSKYKVEDYFNLIKDDIYKEINGLEFNLKFNDSDDITILLELFVYKNHEKIPSVTEIYLNNNKFRNEEKVKMLNSMKNSYVSLFKVVDVDYKEGYVIYEDVFTKKRVKVIDIAMSSSLKIDKKRTVYVYNRIITYEDITFGTGMHCMMTSHNNKLKKFIDKHKYKKCSDFSRCVLLYNISKKETKLVVTHNNQYGYR